jgi:hypothetical protein
MTKFLDHFRKRRSRNTREEAISVHPTDSLTSGTLVTSSTSTFPRQASNSVASEGIPVPSPDALESGDSPPASSASANPAAQPAENVSPEDGGHSEPDVPKAGAARLEGDDPEQQTDQQGEHLETDNPLNEAEKRLEESAEKLDKAIPRSKILRSGELKIKGCADINSMADNVAYAIGALMKERNIDQPQQSVVKALIKGWVKKALPFIQKGLTAATVHYMIRRLY